MNRIVVHVAEVEIDEHTGMGRIAYHWRDEFVRRGMRFVHLGPKEVGPVPHRALFPQMAYRAFTRLRVHPDVLLVHEPAGGWFVRHQLRPIVFSHGIERRMWELLVNGRFPMLRKPSLRTRLAYPLWRLRGCDKGLARGRALLLSSEEDRSFVRERYGRAGNDVFVFRNGVSGGIFTQAPPPSQVCRILFMGTWLERKGVGLLSQAATELNRRMHAVEWVLAGTQVSKAEVFNDWPEVVHNITTVIPSFKTADEAKLLQDCDVFVLPSFFEGQPLALVQAMAAGLCCITSDCCGQKDVITHDSNGLLHRVGDFMDLTERLQQAITQPALRERLGRNARLSVADRNWSSVSGEVVDFVQRAPVNPAKSPRQS